LNNQWFSKVAVWLVIAMVLFTVFKQFDTRAVGAAGHMGYSEFSGRGAQQPHQERNHPGGAGRHRDRGGHPG
jgi:hypothetical protein